MHARAHAHRHAHAHTHMHAHMHTQYNMHVHTRVALRGLCITYNYARLDHLLLAYVSQISRPVEASQALVSSSRLTIPSLPDGGRCCGQTSKMWSTVCSGAPHSQTEESLRPHFSMDELNRPTPVRRRLRVVHCFRGKSRPGTLCGSRMKLCSLEGGSASQLSFQRVLSQDCFVTPGGAKSLR